MRRILVGVLTLGLLLSGTPLRAQLAPSQVLLLGTVNSDGTVSGVTTGTSQAINCAGADSLVVYVRGIGTISGGTVLVEEVDALPSEGVGGYGGTWSLLATITASSLTGNVQQAVHVSRGAVAYLRVRVSSSITGGGSVLITLRKQG